MVFSAISSALFGSKGLAGGVIDVLKGAGILEDPELKLKALEAMNKYQSEVMNNEAKVIESVNATMRAEAKSDHWAQWLWRPTVGFTFAGVIISNYILTPFAQSFGLEVPVIDIPANVWLAMLTVLGAAAYTRGVEKQKRLQ